MRIPNDYIRIPAAADPLQPTSLASFALPSAPTGLLSRTVLPTIDPGPAVVQVLIRWVLDNLTMPRSRFAL